jgi:uncharacterized membrane protein YedE/YeeE
MIHVASAFGAGLLFSIGLAVSGMTNPDKVMNFLDVSGTWDPSLAFVMGGAVTINGLLYWLSTKRQARPVFAPAFKPPAASAIDGRLIAGAALFGVGWGLAGYCPGPAIAGLGALSADAALFVVSMIVGVLAFEGWQRATRRDA